VLIQPMAFANSIKEAAKYMNVKILGKKLDLHKALRGWCPGFGSAVLPITKDQIIPERLFVPRSGSWREQAVWKIFPMIPEWSGP